MCRNNLTVHVYGNTMNGLGINYLINEKQLMPSFLMIAEYLR